MLKKLFLLSVFTGSSTWGAQWCCELFWCMTWPQRNSPRPTQAMSHPKLCWDTTRPQLRGKRRFLSINYCLATQKCSPIPQAWLTSGDLWLGMGISSSDDLSQKKWKKIWFCPGLSNNDPWLPHLYAWLYDICSYFRERWILCSLHVHPATASPLPKAHLLMAMPVSSDGNSPNITTDLFKLRVVVCLTGLEWVIALNQLPKPTTPRYIQIWAIFKLFLVMSEPCSLPAYQKTSSSQPAVTMIEFLPVSSGVFPSPLQAK